MQLLFFNYFYLENTGSIEILYSFVLCIVVLGNIFFLKYANVLCS